MKLTTPQEFTDKNDRNYLLKKIEEQFEIIMQDNDIELPVIITITGAYRRSIMDNVVQLYNDAGWKSVSFIEESTPLSVRFYFYK